LVVEASIDASHVELFEFTDAFEMSVFQISFEGNSVQFVPGMGAVVVWVPATAPRVANGPETPIDLPVNGVPTMTRRTAVCGLVGRALTVAPDEAGGPASPNVAASATSAIRTLVRMRMTKVSASGPVALDAVSSVVVRILVIGGTRFTGRALVANALDRGRDVTLFNRGQSDPAAFPEAEHVRGDRDGGIAVLEGREFDAVVDMCGYFPRVVRQSVTTLAPTSGHSTFVSSISVYREPLPAGYDETSPLRTADPTFEEITEESYGGLKALCEREVLAGFPDRSFVVRSGLMVGPGDRSDRFTYWVRRIALGGEVLAPGDPARPVQFIDARDLGSWMLAVAERGGTGTFNATGPDRILTMGEVLETCRAVSGSDATFNWVDQAFIRSAGVDPVELPLSESETGTTFGANVQPAVAAGLQFRPLAETVRDTLEWDRGRPQKWPMLAGIAPDREAAVLARWPER
jgi:2'-hydroxyisoflavone reductase